MKIKDYKYDIKGFQQASIEALKARDEASKKLTEVEKAQKGLALPTMEYYNAYLEYMTTDNAHMKSYLDYIKYYYDAMTHYGKEQHNIMCGVMAQRLEKCFDAYYELYEKLSKAENAFRQSIKNTEATVSNLTEVQRVYLLHASLMNSDSIHFNVHAQVEDLRSSLISPLLERCDLLIPENAKPDGSDEPNA